MATIKPFGNTSPSQTPGSEPKYKIPEPKTLTAKDHSIINENGELNPNYNSEYHRSKNLSAIKKHNSGDFIKDEAPPTNIIEQVGKEANGDTYSTEVPAFYGTRTSMNPMGDPEKQKILDTSVETYDVERSVDLGGLNPPITPDLASIRMHPNDARLAVMTTYNRAKMPIADVEFRKGIRHIFFTRPECYLMCDTTRLCEQAAIDEDIVSTYQRLPHLIKMLSPVYITGSFSQDGFTNSNFNFLLSNRVQGLSTTQTSISVAENTPKGYSGYTVMPASIIDSLGSSTLELSFNETKNLEVYEYLRNWMLYMSKRHKGTFAPSYNGYQYRNAYPRLTDITNIDAISGISSVSGANTIPYYLRLHPYDRALEYCSTIFDIITNESGTRIIYWCKYYGVYPVSATPGLTNENNSIITESKTSASFRYMYKLEGNIKSLLEFNYNAGIVNERGEVIESVKPSLPYLLRNDGFKTNDSLQELRAKHKDAGDADLYIANPTYRNPRRVLPVYNGASGIFTGSPYIVMQEPNESDPTNPEQRLAVPYLRFATLRTVKRGDNSDVFNNDFNHGYVNDVDHVNALQGSKYGHETQRIYSLDN